MRGSISTPRHPTGGLPTGRPPGSRVHDRPIDVVEFAVPAKPVGAFGTQPSCGWDISVVCTEMPSVLSIMARTRNR